MTAVFDWGKHVQMFKHNLDIGKWEVWQFLAPVVAYWTVCIVYDIFDRSSSALIKQYRLNENKRENSVTKTHVVLRVMLQHVIQTALGLGVLFFDPHMCSKPEKSLLGTCIDLILGMVVMDTWQFWIHRWMHVNKFLYNAIHSHHHRIYNNYAFGALYNHPVEAFFLDSLGGVVTMYATGMTCRTSAIMFAGASMKTVFDHSSYKWPLNPVYNLFPNNSRYHNVHHDLRGFKNNYSQPFFTFWDQVMGSYLHPDDMYGKKTDIKADSKPVEGKKDS